MLDKLITLKEKAMNFFVELVNNHPIFTETGGIILILLLSFYAGFLVIQKRKKSFLKQAGKLSLGGLRVLLSAIIAIVLLSLFDLFLKEQAIKGFYVEVSKSLILVALILRIIFYAMRNTLGAFWSKRYEFFLIGVVGLAFVLVVLDWHHSIIAYLNSIEFGIVKQKFTLWDIVEALLVLGTALIIALALSLLFQNYVLIRVALQPNLKVIIMRLMHTLTLILAVLIGLSLIGVDLTALSIFSGALGVGLGFGLQKIAANYISGFIILLDRSISIGDMIGIQGHYGEVTKIATRYTIIKSISGVESIVPNENLVSEIVTSDTHTNRVVRKYVDVQVGYGTDLELAKRICEEVARNHERVLPEPAPVAYIQALADSGINIQTALSIHDPENGHGVLVSDILIEIVKRFEQENISIPYPVRDLRITQHSVPSGFQFSKNPK